MLQGKRTRRTIAATLMVILLSDTFAPGISYALTSGPTQPEATSFEPIDTTDMVNMQTGDFTYNTPLLEVPGPEGGYPLALSYHAAIQPNEDASWVGLGWTLNPGAITRSVNGFPDDWYTPSTNERDFWAGGSTTTFNIGASVGIAETPATVSFGLSFSQDTYRGFGVGLDVGVGYHLQGTPLSAGLSLGISPYGDPYMSGGIGESISMGGKSPVMGSIGLGFQTNFQTISAGFTAGVGYSFGQQHGQNWGGSMLGISLSTGGTKPSLSLGGLSGSISNDKAGQISTHSTGFNVDIPVYYGVNISLGFNKTRYMSDESVNINTHGSLFPNGWGGYGNEYGSIADLAAYDEYALLEDASYKNIVDNPDPRTVQGGAYPDYDVYSVNAQGLGGNMRPYQMQGTIVAENDNSNSPTITYYSPGVTDNQPVFRFVNDFSNSYRQKYDGYGNPDLNLRTIAPPFDTHPVYGNNDGNYGYSAPNELAGSKYVSTTIKVRARNARGYDSTQRHLDGYMIEGYSITNESGVTYNFGLPAYSYGEENYQEKLNNRSPLTFTRSTRATPYAYTWYLTSVTGPDFVDRNGDGKADDGDWGYWVDYEYGKANDAYMWRNPSQGYQKDEDNQFQNCSMGYKEVYYLNAIRTRTHVALFEKFTRLDAKGESYPFGKINNTYYSSDGTFDQSSAQSEGLSHIYLLNASDENIISYGAGYSPNTLDKEDVDAVGRAYLESKALKVIDFNYNYSLCPGTANSFDINSPLSLSGKLTLNSLVTRGQEGANLLPATQFSYELTNPVFDGSATLNAANGTTPASFVTGNPNFNPGDMVTAPSLGVYCGVITGPPTSSGGRYTYTLANCNYTGGQTTTRISTTKNPPYNKDAYDAWGLYKSDYSLAQIGADENIGRQTTPLSAAGADAWSLRQITTPIGGSVKIAYQPDDFSQSVLSADYSYIANSVVKVSDGTVTSIAFQLNTQGYTIGGLLNTGKKGSILLVAHYHSVSPPDGSTGDTYQTYTANYTVTGVNNTTGIVSADLDMLLPATINDPALGQCSFSDFSTGNVSAANTGSYGGGVRVSSVTVTDLTGYASTVSYDYTDGNGISSGVTSYMPTILPRFDQNAVDNSVGSTVYKRVLYANISNLYSIARELPPPGVMYKYVTVSSQVQDADETTPRDVPGVTQYEFEVFRPNMVGRVDLPVTGNVVAPGRTVSTDNSVGTITTHNLAIMRYTAGLGNVKRIIQYDKKTSDRKILSETINHYLDEGLENLSLTDFRTQYQQRLAQYFYQGFIQERYSETKVVGEQGYHPASKVMATLSAREEYPCIQTGQTEINYVNGTQTTSQNLAFDFYSGAVTQTLETDAYGNSVMTEKLPAYRQYTSMGLKWTSENYKNMLTQIAETSVWKVDATTTPVTKLGLISAEATTWTDQMPTMNTDGSMVTQNNVYAGYGDVWRSQKTYDWKPSGTTTDGLTHVTALPNFSYTNPSASDPGWVKSSETTLYDVYSKNLEETDINGNYTATRLNNGDQKIILTGGPANYYEIAYSGAEDASLNETAAVFVQAADGTPTTAAAHTGAQSLLLGTSGKKGFLYSVPVVISGTNGVIALRDYIASVWVKPVTGSASDVKLYYSINGSVKTPSVSSANSKKIAGDWTLITLNIPGADLTQGTTLNVWAQNDNGSVPAYVDDMRFQPLNATTTAYVYDPFNGSLTHMLDNNNLYTRFEYDAAGRLVRTYKEKLNTATFTNGEFKTNQYQYNYSTARVGNDLVNNSFQKNNCALDQGYVGNSIPVQVPANTYYSFISQTDADATANVYAQDYANLHAGCSCSPGWGGFYDVANPNFQISLNGSRVTFTISFDNPNGATSFKLGRILGSCAFPNDTRSLTLYNGSSSYAVTVTSTGTLSAYLASGAAQTGNISLTGIYDLNVPLFYSTPGTISVQRSNCGPEQIGTSVPIYIYANQFIATSQTDLNSMISNYLTIQGNTLGSCNTVCTFTPNTALYAEGTVSSGASGPVNFAVSFQVPSPTSIYYSLGTVDSGCRPSTNTSTSVTVGNQTWTVLINSDGTFRARRTGGDFENSGDMIYLQGSYTK